MAQSQGEKTQASAAQAWLKYSHRLSQQEGTSTSGAGLIR
jgi:hypothetical protein